MTSDIHQEIHPGPLNNLTLHVQAESGESFYLFSSEHVRLNAIPTTNTNGPSLSQSSRRSATPSPQKLQRLKHAQLDKWTIRLCQKIDLQERSKNAVNDDSSTEEDEENSQKQKRTVKKEPRESVANLNDKEVIAWYLLSLEHDQIQPLLDQAKVRRWDELETLIRSAWDAGSVDVLGREEDQKDDQTYTELRLQFQFQNNCSTRATSLPFASSQRIKRETPTVKEEEGLEELSNEKVISLQLHRISEKADEIQHASNVAIELMKAMGTLRTKAQSLERERNSSRKLIHDNRKNERYHEPSTSLVNPGRIKRKSQDDGGFEGDEEE
ncbi:uncharacterized protein FA14DRAFT_159930 [Meira miltonrushii]|uniref:Uncharacterized protein n=1 Tax=Meira miltonrushii TaxID=1280837 RepID=A0A316VQ67_9BASI|nr:uncharacterized protein FA14DRAFT_159930 [Meira miltonrushii]PWN38311.1 hypothetical protein FA14DRAFT_159930 [Meira miltonrushii]